MRSVYVAHNNLCLFKCCHNDPEVGNYGNCFVRNLLFVLVITITVSLTSTRALGEDKIAENC